MTSAPIVTVVTGANRGIGLAIVSAICASNQTPAIVYAVSRTGNVISPPVCHPATTLRFAACELDQPTSIDSLASLVQSEEGRCDVLINNAGVFYYQNHPTFSQQKQTIDVNYFGTLRMCQAFLPLMSTRTGRIVNLSSVNGLLSRWYSPGSGRYFQEHSSQLEPLHAMLGRYLSMLQQGVASEQGWPSTAYAVSKSAVIAATRLLARQHPELLINSCCPGWVNTDLGAQAGQPPKTPAQGALIPLRLAFQNIDGISGEFWANASATSTGDGRVASWVDNSPKEPDLFAK